MEGPCSGPWNKVRSCFQGWMWAALVFSFLLQTLAQSSCRILPIQILPGITASLGGSLTFR